MNLPEMNRVHKGDVLEVLKTWPDDFVQTVVTSPPYWALRSYLKDDSPDKMKEIGSEPTPEAYVAKIVEVFREVRRVLRPDGTLWLNLGDTYNSGPAGSRDAARWPKQSRNGSSPEGRARFGGLKHKDLCLIPARVVLALQADGWYVRQRIVWAKGVSFRPDFSGSCMPESAQDRPTTSHEEIFLLTRNAHYFYDAEAVKEQGRIAEGSIAAKGSSGRKQKGVNGRPPDYWEYTGRRNLRSVWAINPDPFPEAHFATFPIEIPDTAIKAGTSERGGCPACGAPRVRIVKKRKIVASGTGSHVAGADQVKAGAGEKGFRNESKWTTDTQTIGWKTSCGHKLSADFPCVVLDPFSGAGTTFLAAARSRRDFLGIELSQDYIDITNRRLAPELAQGKLL